MIGLFNENVGLYSSIVVRVYRSNILNLDIAIQIIVHNAFAIIDGRTFLACVHIATLVYYYIYSMFLYGLSTRNPYTKQYNSKW